MLRRSNSTSDKSILHRWCSANNLAVPCGCCHGSHSSDLSHRCCCAVAEEATSLELRQTGNAAFKEGRLSEALQLYHQAAAHNPQDFALFTNISLAALKNGDPQQVCHTVCTVCGAVLCCAAFRA